MRTVRELFKGSGITCLIMLYKGWRAWEASKETRPVRKVYGSADLLLNPLFVQCPICAAVVLLGHFNDIMIKRDNLWQHIKSFSCGWPSSITLQRYFGNKYFALHIFNIVIWKQSWGTIINSENVSPQETISFFNGYTFVEYILIVDEGKSEISS